MIPIHASFIKSYFSHAMQLLNSVQETDEPEDEFDESRLNELLLLDLDAIATSLDVMLSRCRKSVFVWTSQWSFQKNSRHGLPKVKTP